MIVKKVLTSLTIIFVFLLLITSVNAIVGKIGNGKMILNATTGDVIDRTIRIINDNNVSIMINMFPNGDLENDTVIIDNNFTLNPGEEKNVGFKIYLKKPGVFQNRINVQFTPVDGKNGVGLASQITITVTGEEISDKNFKKLKGETNKDESQTFTTLGNILKSNSEDSIIKTPQIMLLISTVVLIIVLCILYYIYKSKKVGGKKSGENKRSNK